MGASVVEGLEAGGVTSVRIRRKEQSSSTCMIKRHNFRLSAPSDLICRHETLDTHH
jgi:hypothetical protein